MPAESVEVLFNRPPSERRKPKREEVPLSQVYRDRNLILPHEELAVVITLDAIAQIQGIPGIQDFIKAKIKETAQQMALNGYPDGVWEEFRARIDDLYLRNIHPGDISYRQVDLINRTGELAASRFIQAYAVTLLNSG